MRKTLLLAAAITVLSVAVAHADPITDWVDSVLGIDSTQGDPTGNPQPDNDGSGSGS